MILRDGTEADDPRLGRLRQFDERSRSFPIRALVGEKPPRSYTWSVGTNLDQKSDGACVGFSFAHELCARPMVTMVDDRYAKEEIYWPAQRIDPWPGGSYPGASPRYEGTSVLAGAKVCQSLGHFTSYRWGFSLEDVVLAIGYAGPVVLGLDWHRGMMEPEPDGRIRPTGQIYGGHAILAYRVAVPTRKREVGQVWLHNSWGDWGPMGGTCWMSFDDLAQLLRQQGEACVPVGRQKAPLKGKEPLKADKREPPFIAG